MTKLPNDVSRCHDESCSEREKCRRWLERMDTNYSSLEILSNFELIEEPMVFVHSASLYPFDDRILLCPYKIDVEKDK